MERSNQSALKMMTLAAMITALTIVMGLMPRIPLLLIPVPIVLQNMGVMMAGDMLGTRYGTLSVGIFLLLVSLGLPILSGGLGGAVVFLGATGGYLVAWLFAPLVINLIKNVLKGKIKNQLVLSLLSVWLGGAVFIDVFGAFWLAIQAPMPLSTAMFSTLLFIPGDTIKAILVIIIANRLEKIVHLN
ncbi:biotin transporter BioY [Pediococcus pentosaceus]|uniref:biotin transporter BioY n=1 Tax=Pediococcus pentosaceus TaxID=1255 RepID=UPI000852FDB1|nr:biotin transporter BioY [Pediococcus pentosaceus]